MAWSKLELCGVGRFAWNLSDIGGLSEEGVSKKKRHIREFAEKVPEHSAASVCFCAGSYCLVVFQGKRFKNCLKNAYQMYDGYQSEKSV